MGHFVKLYFFVVLVFLAVDLTWLGFLMTSFYKAELGPLARRVGEALAPVWWAAALVYVLIPLGIVVFVLPRVSPENLLGTALGWGFLYGIILYGVYDLTNYSLIARWPGRLTFVDLVWGGCICAVTSAIAVHLDRWLG
ncbi:MAG: DUF2177 family protein [Desulfobacca sp.]|uniref:DUF2177 family protein n=1 Tax=Desulfobacca sp. TaxID=2067990 RepID=UPI00404A4C67